MAIIDATIAARPSNGFSRHREIYRDGAGKEKAGMLTHTGPSQ
jgi:hypothetical protein